MELGRKIKQARLDAGLSQRQLCADEITRNMLSQIENGTAQPSMATLRYLAKQLGKPISFFLDEEAVVSANLELMEQARTALRAGNFPAVEAVLATYRVPDPVFDLEYQLISRLATLAAIETALNQNKLPYAAQLLDHLGPIREGYCCSELERRRLLLLAKLRPRDACPLLPSLDEELLLRARDALDRGQPDRSGRLLEAAENQESPQWKFLRGEVHMASAQYEAAADCFRAVEAAYPLPCAARLERCYRELGNFEKAYFYACKQREIKGG